MLLTHLSLQHFRNYLSLELDLSPGPTVLLGENAQGKTNLLEAVYLLSTGRSPRATADRELMTRCLPPGELPVTRLAAEAQRAAGPLKLEMALLAAGWLDAARGDGVRESDGGSTGKESASGSAQKRVRINGTPRRLLDLIGQLPAVLFSPEDLELVTGMPAVRRRYLDITLSQLDPRYARTLQRYQRVVVQRNHLLRLLQEGRAQEGELAFWDDALLDAGTVILSQRLAALAELGPLASAIQPRLTTGRDVLEVQYAPAGATVSGQLGGDPSDLRRWLATALEAARRREVALGQTVVGPHRDDLRLVVNGAPVGTFGSRGQQRTTALALKLAEAEYLRRQGGDDPILLLDDALSEMDQARRLALTEAARSFHQVLITTADPGQIPPDFLAEATRFRVVSGQVDAL